MGQKRWRHIAQAVCLAITEANPCELSEETDINQLLQQLRDLADVDGCPGRYIDQVAELDVNGNWARDAKRAHVLLGKLCDDEGAEEYYADQNQEGELIEP